MARPPTKPLKREGRWTYRMFMEQPICFPTETASSEDIACIRAINAGCKKDMDTEITDEQHYSLNRLLSYQTIFIGK